ncbi:unnamed protein product [Onchocerca ochengi]|uniref:CNH domain-containing protein n=1 Tax=Onchocerca ochengi TaxID=42157 RepID=A0A182EQE1_ONCOC|nr:unnamed protein product [Onchocerca ochengi]
MTKKKNATSNNRRSVTKSQHHSIADESNFVTKSVTLRTLRQNLATLKLHQHIEQLPLNDDDLTNIKRKMEQATQMKLLREVTFPNNVKVVGLAMQRGLLYVATNDGQITMINPKTNKQVDIINISDKINRMTVTHNGDIIILNGTNVISYRNAKKYRELELPIIGKSLSAFKNEIGLERIIALGRSNDVLFVLTNDLKPIEEMYFKNDAKETCNFAILYQKHYYISCQSAILQLSENGEIKKKIGINNGTFSLGITIDDQARIIAIVRGQPLLRVFQVNFDNIIYIFEM